MDWQTMTAWAAIALAGIYLAWQGVRALRGGKHGCSGGCGCDKTKPQPKLVAPEQLVLRIRD